MRTGAAGQLEKTGDGSWRRGGDGSEKIVTYIVLLENEHSSRPEAASDLLKDGQSVFALVEEDARHGPARVDAGVAKAVDGQPWSGDEAGDGQERETTHRPK